MIPNANIEGASFLYIIDLIATILSFVGSLTMCYLCLRMKAPRTISHKFILAISVADFFYSISNILSNFETKDTTKLCFIEGFIRESAFILTIFFSTCTAVASLRIFWANSDSENKSLSRSALIIGPALCFCMSVLL